METTTKHTNIEYNAFQRAYDHFNRVLFNNELPQCLITLQRTRSAYGYFWHSQFTARNESGAIDEIALNPDAFAERSDEEILSTLGHEMCHLWQVHFGKPSRAGYHNREWADKMESIGLTPSSTGREGGKRTGQSMTHYITPDGAFTKAYGTLVKRGVKLNWNARGAGAALPGKKAPKGGNGAAGTAAKKRASKTKYTCTNCGANAWAKAGSNLVCGTCLDETGDVHRMEAQS